MLPGKKLAVVVICLFILCSATVAGAVELSDIKGHWAENDIRELVALGAITGYPDGLYRPQNTITRAEFSSVLRGALGLAEVPGTTFSDTVGHWGEGRIEALVQAGVIDTSLYGQNYNPNGSITREEIAMMTVRMLRIMTGATNIPFLDKNQIGTGYDVYVAEAYAWGIVRGYPDNTFRPKGTATRAEAAVMTIRAMRVLYMAEPNRSPVIFGLTFSGDTLVTGETYTVTAVASHPDGDTLTYLWQVSGGSVPNANTNPINWTTPSAPGSYQIAVTVRDERGGEATAIQDVAVFDPPSGNGVFIPPDIYLPPFQLLFRDSLSPIPGESGSIVEGADINLYFVSVGDSVTNKGIRGFISFDISGLSGKTVHSAELRLAEPEVYNNPSSLHGIGHFVGLRLNNTYWGERSLILADFDPLPYNTVAAYTDYDIVFTRFRDWYIDVRLVDLLQQRIDNGDNRFQMQLLFPVSTNNNGKADFVRYGLDKITLKVAYN